MPLHGNQRLRHLHGRHNGIDERKTGLAGRLPQPLGLEKGNRHASEEHCLGPALPCLPNQGHQPLLRPILVAVELKDRNVEGMAGDQAIPVQPGFPDHPSLDAGPLAGNGDHGESLVPAGTEQDGTLAWPDHGPSRLLPRPYEAAVASAADDEAVKIILPLPDEAENLRHRLVIAAGEAVELVGETGCGKSVTARAIMGFVEPPGRVENGQILLEGENLLQLSERAMRRVRGRRISFVFQEPRKALDPTATVGSQLIEAAVAGRGVDSRKAKALALEMLAEVGLADGPRVMQSYSFELSGGMAQRAMIAMGAIGGSRLMIADEPTSALDVSIQAQILRLLQKIRTARNSALLLITHDLGVVAENCDRIIVMYAGQIVENGPVRQNFRSPAHPYTDKLLRALPAPGKTRLESIPGVVPDLIAPPPGCRFSNRCDRASERCRAERPPVLEAGVGHAVACFHPVNAG